MAAQHDPNTPDTSAEAKTRKTRSRTRRVLRGLGYTAGGLAGFTALTIAVALIAANTNPGRRFIEHQTTSLTGGTVRISGLGGRFPDALHVTRIELLDARGAWLTLDNLTFDWAPLALLARSAHVNRLAFDRLAIPRLAESTSTEPTKSSGPTHTGLSIHIDAVDGKRIEVGAPVAGLAMAVGLHGHAQIGELDQLLNSPSVVHLPDADIGINAERLDATGRVHVTARTGHERLAIKVAAEDSKDGILANMAKMPELTPATLTLSLAGPVDRAALDLHAALGAVNATVNGSLNLAQNTAAITAALNAPAMTPLTGVSWQSVTLSAHLNGRMAAPSGDATLDIANLVAGGAQIGALNATFDGLGSGQQTDRLHLHATAKGLRIPGGNPTLLASAPFELDATVAPNQTNRPVTLTASHPLLALAVQADTLPDAKGHATLNLPDLGPFAAMGGQTLKGHASLASDFSVPLGGAAQTGTVSLTGTVAADAGQPQAVALIGPNGTLKLNVHMVPDGKGRVIHLDTLTVDGRTLHLAGTGSAHQNEAGKITVDSHATVGLSDLSGLAAMLRGKADIDLTASGPTDDLSAQAHLVSDFGTASMPRGPLTLDADLHHLPSTPAAHVTAGGTLDRAPLSLDLAFAQAADGGRHLDITKLDWNSLHGTGALDLPTKRKIPLGALDIKIGRLADLRNLIGQPIAGTVSASLHSTAASDTAPEKAAIAVNGNATYADYKVGKLSLNGTVTDPENAPAADLALTLDSLVAPQIAGSLKATVKGPPTALAVLAQARFSDLYGGPGQLDLAAVENVSDKRLRLERLVATAKGETIRLQAPLTATYGATMGVDRLRATLAPNGVTPATIDIAGTVKPALALTAAIHNVTPALARPFMPTLDAAGTLGIDAHLSGQIEAPRGDVQVTARDLHMRTGDAASLPPAHIDAKANLAGTSAQIDARIGAGPKIDLAASGTVPLSKTGPLNVRGTGAVDLSVANAVLGASGRQAQGDLHFALNVAGTTAHPDASGTVTLHNGDVRDFAQGLHLADIEAQIQAEHDSIVIQSFTAKAGQGTLGLSGQVGAFAPGMPVDLHFMAAKAQPVSSDLLTALMNADVTVRGQADTRLDVQGKVVLPHVEINIPNSMPSSVATLNVVRPGDKPPAPDTAKTSTRVIGLDLTLASPGEFFVRGHGLDAEMAGKLHVGGTANAPAIEGGFDMRRGLFNLVGITLNFTRGRVGFDGSGVEHKLDPTLDFEADRNVNGQTAMLKVGGYASNPKISFDSIPSLPQDQVLAMLIFGTDAHSLSSTQMAELGAALATLSGGAGFDPLGAVRKTLGLDRLAIGGGSGVGNGGTSIEAGKYVMKGVYVGAKQATSGSGTQAQVQVDLTRQLKLNTTVGTGGNVTGFTTPENDPGSSVGLLWQYRY